MGAKLYDRFITNWRFTVMGLLGAVAAGACAYIQAGNHVTYTGLGIAVLIALLGGLKKDFTGLGVINTIIAQHGIGAVIAQVKAAQDKQKAVVTIALNGSDVAADDPNAINPYTGEKIR